MRTKKSRVQRHAELLAAARAARIPSQCDVCVIGAGAAGIVAATVAAEAGASVIVLERDLEEARTILATGNGRCNFCNVELDSARYNDPAFVNAVFGNSALEDILAYFRTCGLRWCLEGPRLYPVSRQAASVRNVLLSRAREAGALLAPAHEALGIAQHGAAYAITYAQPGEAGDTGQLLARRVILATGRSDLPDASLGLVSTTRTPALCPITCKNSPLAALDGRRVHAAVSLRRGAFPSWRERGEVLFRSYGLSGIVIFDASRRVRTADIIELDLVPDVSSSELAQLADPDLTGTIQPGRLDGILDPVIAATLEELAHRHWWIDEEDHEPPTTDTAALMELVRHLSFRVTGLADTSHAQILRGGLTTSQFQPNTLEAKQLPGFFACGEALDIDADCGGFNLAWAWKSGMVAGTAAAKEAGS